MKRYNVRTRQWIDDPNGLEFSHDKTVLIQDLIVECEYIVNSETGCYDLLQKTIYPDGSVLSSITPTEVGYDPPQSRSVN